MRILLLFIIVFLANDVFANQTRIKDIARYQGVRDNALIGYGLVTGLSGTGDSSRSKSTIQSLQNTLENFGVIIDASDIQSRNIAAVIITGQLPSFGQAGDKIDVTVSSLGDAKSLAGGTLMLASLKAANGDIYALAQGVISVGGYRFEADNNVVQKNHPTVGRVVQGATLERSINNQFVDEDGYLHLLLEKPDFTTASRVVDRLQQTIPNIDVEAIHAGKILIKHQDGRFPISLLSKIENVRVNPAQVAKVIVNEKTGTIVSGTQVAIGDVVISHGSLKLTIKTDYFASQPYGLFTRDNDGIRTEVLTDTDVQVEEASEATFVSQNDTTIAELVDGLKSLNLNTREIISILQALKESGAMNAELVIQ